MKIDQSFIRDLGHGDEASAIVDAILRMAHELRYATIAEGVEQAAELAFLREHGCEEVQGYLFSRPVPAAEFTARWQADSFPKLRDLLQEP